MEKIYTLVFITGGYFWEEERMGNVYFYIKTLLSLETLREIITQVTGLNSIPFDKKVPSR